MSDLKQHGEGQAYEALKLAIAGGLAFWVANFAISRTAVAAEYRTALSISYLPMLVESLIGGLIIGFCFAFVLLRYFDKIPTKNSILKSVMLSVVTLVFFTVVFEAPGTFLSSVNDATRYFLIGTAINVVRILALGLVIGYLYGKINTQTRLP
jgi:NhaP-type Na+/H+ and K+/H+ antiporter